MPDVPDIQVAPTRRPRRAPVRRSVDRDAAAVPPVVIPRRLAFSDLEAGQLLGGLSPRTVYGLRASGQLAYVLVGTRVLIPAFAIRQFLRQNVQQAVIPDSISTGHANNIGVVAGDPITCSRPPCEGGRRGDSDPSTLHEERQSAAP